MFNNQLQSNWIVKNIRKAALPKLDNDESSEDGMFVLSNHDSLQEEVVDNVHVTPLRDSIICPRYDPCVLRYGKLPTLSSWGTTVLL